MRARVRSRLEAAIEIVHADDSILNGVRKPFHGGRVPRFFDGCLGGFGCCTTIKNVRRYTSVEGIVIRQVGADAETTTERIGISKGHFTSFAMSGVG